MRQYLLASPQQLLQVFLPHKAGRSLPYPSVHPLRQASRPTVGEGTHLSWYSHRLTSWIEPERCRKCRRCLRLLSTPCGSKRKQRQGKARVAESQLRAFHIDSRGTGDTLNFNYPISSMLRALWAEAGVAS